HVIKLLICPSDALPQTVVENTAAVTPPWSRGFYGMSSYGGNAGTRSVPVGAASAFSGLSRGGIFWICSCGRNVDIARGSTHTFPFGEGYHRDPAYDERIPDVQPGIAPIAQVGKWGWIAGPPGVMGNVMLHSAAPINYRMPPDGDSSALFDRQCAFGSGHVH